jgi:hypothetical protein
MHQYLATVRETNADGTVRLSSFAMLALIHAHDPLVPTGTVHYVDQVPVPVWVPESRLGAYRSAHPATCYTCPACGATSFGPEDLAHGYCGRCHRFQVDLRRVPQVLAR